jgi:hypothetical protein
MKEKLNKLTDYKWLIPKEVRPGMKKEPVTGNAAMYTISRQEKDLTGRIIHPLSDRGVDSLQVNNNPERM